MLKILYLYTTPGIVCEAKNNEKEIPIRQKVKAASTHFSVLQSDERNKEMSFTPN